MLFLALTECPHSVYFEEDSSMEASAGLNPASSQGYLEAGRFWGGFLGFGVGWGGAFCFFSGFLAPVLFCLFVELFFSCGGVVVVMVC